jgi:transposase
MINKLAARRTLLTNGPYSPLVLMAFSNSPLAVGEAIWSQTLDPGHPQLRLLEPDNSPAVAAPPCTGSPPRELKHPEMSGDSISWESGAMGRASANYPRELRERAIAMVREVRPDYPSEYAAIEAVAKKLGIGTSETLRKWIRQAEVDAGTRVGVTSDESAEMRKLRAENRELRRANEILKAASAFFAAELDRPLR